MQRREHIRKPVVFTSEILFNNKGVVCSIKNISAGGAKLKITEKQEIEYPRTAVLDISPFGRFTVTIVWHSNEHLGVKFVDAPDKIAEVLIAMAVY
ncbi:PilZ domain-containing protein [Thermodesulfobacteriota bacterium]